MTARIIPFPSRLRPVDDGSVMTASDLLAQLCGDLENHIAAMPDPLEDLVQGVWGRKRERGDGPEAA